MFSFGDPVDSARMYFEYIARKVGVQVIDKPLDEMNVPELAAQYHELESGLLTRWDAPLVNDFFCMIFYKLLEKRCQALTGDEATQLHNRLLFHLSHKFNDEKRLMSFHQNLRDVIEDQLSLASIHYLRSHYQEAIDIYKRILLDNR